MYVHGQIQFPEVDHPIQGATLRIRLLDVSRADAASTTVAEDIVAPVNVLSDGTTFDFTLEVTKLQQGKTYSVEAHLDIDGSGVMELGDYRTMAHVGVSPVTGALQGPALCRRIG